MKAHILDGQYRTLASPIATARCGEDFCDGCGDCLHCYGGDPCPDGAHRWYVYADQLAAFLEQHPEVKWPTDTPSQPDLTA